MTAMPRAFFLCLGLWAMATGLPAADRYVHPTAGNNANPGTLALPWRTFQFAASNAAAGDVVYLRGGTYSERITVGVSGNVGAPIEFRAFTGEVPVVDQTGVTPPNGDSALLRLVGRSNLVFRGIVFQNYRASVAAKTPLGIFLSGACQNVTITGCTIHHIEQNSPTLFDFNANAHGLLVYGDSTTPMRNIVIDGNELHSLRLGASEALTVNGNVDGFAVTGNSVHDCNNIGIDIVGFEQACPDPAQDRARNGVVARNVVARIDSSFNPAYGGNLTTGGGAQAAAGIYVDGGTLTVIERNHVHHSNFGFEVASENTGGRADFIVLRNNLAQRNHGAGLILGGYDHDRGETRDCQILNNTFYLNDTALGGHGQITLQFYLSQNVFRNNILWAQPSTRTQIAHVTEFDSGASAAQKQLGAGNVFDYNLYFCATGSATATEFSLTANGAGYQILTTLAAWRTAIGGDTQSTFGNPGFVVAAPVDAAVADDFRLAVGSAAIQTGQPAPGFVPAVGEKDLFGQSRVAGGRVDRGAHEFLTAPQQWLDVNFGTPDATGSAAWTADPDGDGASNLTEYSQGLNPLRSEPGGLPGAAKVGSNVRFSYRKNGIGVSYNVQTSGNLQSWSVTAVAEQTDGAGLFWREFPLGPAPLYLRLQVTLP